MDLGMKSLRAVVTGAGRGIGEATARALRAAGVDVIVADREFESTAKVAESIGGWAIGVDIADQESVANLVAEAERIGPIDILVNCAGNLQNLDAPENLSMSVWDRIVAVHQRGTYMVTTGFGLKMVDRKQGSIVTIASTAGMRSTPLHSYAPAKAAVIMQTKCLAAEWGWANVRVNCVSPGFVPTPGVSQGFERGVMNETLCREGSALGRFVEPGEIANAVLFLASPLASGVTGVNLAVDNGWLVATNWHSYGGIRRGPQTTEG